MNPKGEKPSISPTASTSTTHQQAAFLPEIFSLQHLLQDLPTERDWVVPGLLPTGVSLLAGPPHIDKALLANQLGLSVATGTPFLGHFPVQQGHVLYLALGEGLLNVRSRVARLLRDQERPDTFDLAMQWSPLRQHGLADLEDTVAQLTNPRLIVIDPLESILPLPSHQQQHYRVRQTNTPLHDLQFFIPLRELAAHYKLAILLLHHLPDDWPTNRRDPLAGMSPNGLTAATACNLLLTPAHENGTCTLHIAGTDVEECRLTLAFDGHTGQWSYRLHHSRDEKNYEQGRREDGS